MAEKNFFILIKNKLALLRPSEQYRDQDWGALGERLDATMPCKPTIRRPGLVLPFLLATALLSSNAVWWKVNLNGQARLAHLENQTAMLQKNLAALGVPAAASTSIRQRDTIWQTAYISLCPNHSLVWSAGATPPEKRVPPSEMDTLAGAFGNNKYRIPDDSEHFTVPTDRSSDRRETTNAHPHSVVLDNGHQKSPPLAEQAPIKPFAQKLSGALRPKFFKIGIQSGLDYALGRHLMHQGGYSIELRAQVGISRHWALSIAHTMGRFHYKAHETAAILGQPSLPMPPSGHHHYTDFDVTGQRSHQWDWGARYTFSQPGKPRAFIGLGWASQTLMPFSVEYVIRHEPSGAIDQGVYPIHGKTRLRNYLRLSAGLDLPMTKRLNLTLEGHYQRRWKKPIAAAPDLAGIRVGAHRLF